MEISSFVGFALISCRALCDVNCRAVVGRIVLDCV